MHNAWVLTTDVQERHGYKRSDFDFSEASEVKAKKKAAKAIKPVLKSLSPAAKPGRRRRVVVVESSSSDDDDDDKDGDGGPSFDLTTPAGRAAALKHAAAQQLEAERKLREERVQREARIPRRRR